MAYAGMRLSKMARHRIWVTASLGSVNFLLRPKEYQCGIMDDSEYAAPWSSRVTFALGIRLLVVFGPMRCHVCIAQFLSLSSLLWRM